jgi:hypothetical protein
MTFRYRGANFQQYEDSNILTRNLKQQQKYVLILQIGLWSGDKRRVEIAESFVQPVVTVRQATRFLDIVIVS